MDYTVPQVFYFSQYHFRLFAVTVIFLTWDTDFLLLLLLRIGVSVSSGLPASVLACFFRLIYKRFQLLPINFRSRAPVACQIRAGRPCRSGGLLMIPVILHRFSQPGPGGMSDSGRRSAGQYPDISSSAAKIPCQRSPKDIINP